MVLFYEGYLTVLFNTGVDKELTIHRSETGEKFDKVDCRLKKQSAAQISRYIC